MQSLPATAPQAPRRHYASLTEAEKWDWHARVYAFRRVILGVADDVRTSPCDEHGVWFDEPRVIAETARLRRAGEEAKRKRNQVRDENAMREGRAICNGWARGRGYPDFPAAQRDGLGYADVVRSIGGPKQMPRERHGGGATKAQLDALGVTAKEYNPTPEVMAAARKALGLGPE